MLARGFLLGVTGVLFAGAALAAGRCDDGGEFGPAVAAAREAVRARCDCDGAASPGAYAACAWSVIRHLADDGTLPRLCRGRVRQFATRSTCGRGDVIACCEKSASGPWRATRRPASKGCLLPRDGAMCEAFFPHLDYACEAGGGCRVNRCGDGILDPKNGEGCEPPGVGLCDPWCQVIVCGNGVLDPGEQCEPPRTPTCDFACRAKSCGNGIVEPETEQCEPPNTPTCDDQCYFTHDCGNGVVDATWGEECEPPGTGTCGATCMYVHTCGNGVVELGEECDGQALCDASCRLTRSLCCQLGEFCFGGSASDIGEEYFFSKGCNYTLGGATTSGVCEGTQPCPPPAPPDSICRAGSCVDVPIDPLPLCCQRPDGTCSGSIATTSGGVVGCGWGTFPPPEQGDVERLIVGTCASDGRCVPLTSDGGTP